MPHGPRAYGGASIALAMVVLAGRAAPQAPLNAPPSERRADLLVDHHQVSGGFGDWSSVALRLVLPGSGDTDRPARTIWQVEGLVRHAFGDDGRFGGVAVQHALSADWTGHLSAGAGTGSFIFPDARVDAALSRKWLSRRQLLTTIGGSIVDAKRGYREQSAFASVTLYAMGGMVVEGGGRWNRSTPGPVTTSRAFGAVTLGAPGRRWIAIRGSTGDEGYQLVGPAAALIRFSSQEASLSWREWLGRRWGLLAQGERYTNPHYERTGIAGGLFIHW